MQRRKFNTPMVSVENSNAIRDRDRESPDLLANCVKNNSGNIKNMTIDDWSENSSDVVIFDDDVETNDSDTTIFFEFKNGFVDEKQHSSRENFITDGIKQSKNCEVQEQRKNFLKCKPLSVLLSSESVETHSADDNNVRKNFNTSKCNSLSSSKQAIPVSRKHLKHRKRTEMIEESNSDDSDATFHKYVDDKLPNIMRKSRSDERNQSSLRRIPIKSCSIMRGRVLFEATPPTSESDLSDDDANSQQNRRFSIRHANKKSPEIPAPAEVSTPKYVINENYKVNRNTNIPKTNTLKKKNSGTSLNVNTRSITKKSLKNHEDTHFIDVSDTDNKSTLISQNNEDEGLYEREKWLKRYSKLQRSIMTPVNIRSGELFQPWEQWGILWYLVKTNNYKRIRSKKFWSEIISAGYFKHRTGRSLQNHFLRKILPNINKYKLPRTIVEEFNSVKH